MKMKSAYMAGMFLITAVALSGCKTEGASKNHENTVTTTLESQENVTENTAENKKSDAANQVMEALQTSVYNVAPKTEPVLDRDYAQ